MLLGRIGNNPTPLGPAKEDEAFLGNKKVEATPRQRGPLPRRQGPEGAAGEEPRGPCCWREGNFAGHEALGCQAVEPDACDENGRKPGHASSQDLAGADAQSLAVGKQLEQPGSVGFH